MGRRIFVLFLIAAALPVLVLGAATWRALERLERSQAEASIHEANKAAALGVFDRLTAARLALASGAGAAPGADGRLFRAVEPAPGPAGGAALSWRDGRVWVHATRPDGLPVRGEVEPDYLWGDGAGEEIDQRCVRDAAGAPLRCPAGFADAGATARWPLFLGASFGVADWTFLAAGAARPAGAGAAGDWPRVAVLASLGTLLLVSLLTLVHVRRTLRPLRRLTAATRLVARRRYDVRVPAGGAREFDALAHAFNDMAARLGGQARDNAALAAELLHRATHDLLTGLLDRAGMHEAIDAALAAAPSGGLALLFIDLDRFKSVNDTLGHRAGDELLLLAGQRLQATLPAGARLARLGGDEFIALLAPGDGEAAAAAARAACAALAAPFEVQEHSVMLGASVGVALYPQDGDTRDALLRAADMAMYAAKADARGGVAAYRPALAELAVERAWRVRDLRLALQRGGELVLHFQPRVAVADGRARSCEALVRWRHPQRGLLGPGEFIDAAEDAGLIDALGRWVIDDACRAFAAWKRAGLALGHVALNVSASQLASPTLVDDVRAALARHGLAPRELELEVTESVMMRDVEAAIEVLGALRALGVSVALDDFGTGYSSLAYLLRLPIDVMKLDRAFVRNLGQDEAALAVSRAIVGLALALGKKVVAEGVETPLQARMVEALGCHEMQGFLHARPVDEAAFARLACVAAVPAEAGAS